MSNLQLAKVYSYFSSDCVPPNVRNQFLNDYYNCKNSEEARMVLLDYHFNFIKNYL